MTDQKPHFISGNWIEGSGKIFKSLNPATGKVLWQGNEASEQELDSAVKAARKAFPEWAELPLEGRITFLHRFQKVLNEHRDAFASVISEEMGKPLWDAKGEVAGMISKIDVTIQSYEQRCLIVTKTVPTTGKRLITRYKPHGVIAIFGPFNFPGHLPNGHIVPALLAGNTVVFKPSEHVPKVSSLLLHYWEMAGIQKGVLNMVQGGKEVGKALAMHPGIKGIFFTGSLKTGQWLSEYYGKQMGKILVLELGGNNPLIVSEISDPDDAAQLTILSSYLTSGQRCTCARRLIVPTGERGDHFLKILTSKVSQITVGAYTQNPEPFMGPVISEDAAKQLLQTQGSLIKKGGRPLLKMRALKVGTGLISPGLIDVTAVADRPDEEYFGPFLQIIRVADFAAALEEANRTRFGLTAGLFSDNSEEYELFYQHVKAGIINWNSQLTGASSEAPFGGIGCSGNFRPSGFFAIDYCTYPIASMESETLKGK